MSVFKCKMCGGTIEFLPGETVGVCDSCGTKQTLPKLDTEKKSNLFDRANHFRRNNDFDKAAAIYEQILEEDNTDAESYWSLVLCRYGIEYVEDPKTHKRVPTVNRAQFTSIFDDEDYKSAIKYADGSQRSIYEEEANTINEIQKGILAISQREEPFDVFICYKETDNDGRRTQDSVLANDLYHQLTQEGFKVFFSRITLENKLGTAYEPYIFAALNSAKVMVVLGTKPEFFNAVWVKNEWSRYLALVKQSGGKKMLIPAYKDMDPYDLPEEFSHLQAQDMGKLGFMQDLIRGIKKIVGTDDTAIRTTTTAAGGASVAPLLKRAFMFLEDSEWRKADDFCEQVLNLSPENAQAYLGKLMAELRVRTKEELKNCEEPFDSRNSYQKILRFADDGLIKDLKGYIQFIKERNEKRRLDGLYHNAVKAMNSASTEVNFNAAAALFKEIQGYKDSDLMAKDCLEKAEVCRKDSVYVSAKEKMEEGTVYSYESAISMFSSIPSWKDADEKIPVCQAKIEEIKANDERIAREEEARRFVAEKNKKKVKKIATIATFTTAACIIIVILFINVILPKQKLNKAMKLLDSGEYEAAYELLEEIGKADLMNPYKDDLAQAMLDSGDYDAAYALLEEIGNNDAIVASKYDRAVKLIDSGDYLTAYELLNGLDYKDSESKRKLIESSDEWIELCPVGGTFFFGSYEQDNDLSNGKEAIEWLVLAKEDDRALVISRDALDCQQYHTVFESVSWENSSLRAWLNEAFIADAFSVDEQNSILSSTVEAYDNEDYGTSAGNDTTDKIFLLSIKEAELYYGSSAERECYATTYATTQGVNNKKGGCNWWLRSPGGNTKRAAYVTPDGVINDLGSNVDASDRGSIAVRPAFWIKIGS